MVFPIFMQFMENIMVYFNITTLEMIEGDLPQRAEKLVKDWASLYRFAFHSMGTPYAFPC